MARMRFFERIHGVYFDDLDAYQILHNARYVLLIERTIGAFWDHVFGWKALLDPRQAPDQSHLVRANYIDYLRPVRGVSEVRVRIWIEKLGRTSLVFGFRVLPVDEDTDYAVGQRVMVRIDPETHRPTPWTDEFRQRVAPYCRQAEQEEGAHLSGNHGRGANLPGSDPEERTAPPSPWPRPPGSAAFPRSREGGSAG